MTFLAPLWLAALAALAVPVVIHLLGRGRARTVRVGSVRLLREAATATARRIRPTQLLLLAVRMLLLAALALALAAPRGWPPPQAAADEPAWVLVAPAVLAARAALEPRHGEAYRQIDAAVAEGRARLLAPGLPRLRDRPPESPDLAAVPGGAWSLLREAHALAPAGAAFQVVTTGRVAELAGELPSLPREVAWEVVTDPRPNAWIERAGPRRGAVVPATVGESDAAATRFRQVALGGEGHDAAADGAAGAIGRWRLREGERGPELYHAGEDAVAADDAVSLVAGGTLLAAVLHDPERADDASFVAAALAAAAEAAGLPLALLVEPLPAAVPAGASLVAWLAPAEPAVETVAGVPLVVVDGGATWEACPGRLLLSGPQAASGSFAAAAAPLALRRCSAPGGEAREDGMAGDRGATAAGIALWRDAAGRPWLTATVAADGARWYRLHGRFHPQWSDLVHSAALPAWMGQLLESRAAATGVASSRLPASDRRAVAAAQLLPLRAPQPDQAPRPDATPEVLLWALVALLFAGERVLAAREAR